MDVGVLHLPGNDKLRLYGAPGQDRFDFMWDILLEQAKAAIVLVNHAAPHPERDLALYMRNIADRLGRIAYAGLLGDLLLPEAREIWEVLDVARHRAFGLPAKSVHAPSDIGRESGPRLFAIANDVDAGLDLLADHTIDTRLDLSREFGLVDRLAKLLLK